MLTIDWHEKLKSKIIPIQEIVSASEVTDNSVIKRKRKFKNGFQ